MKTGEDKLKLALYLLDKVDNLLFPLENRGVIGDDIRDYVMEAINELEKWLVESIEKHTEDYLDWKYDRNVYLAGSEKLQNVFDKLRELKGVGKE